MGKKFFVATLTALIFLLPAWTEAFWVVGHRGAKKLLDENTLASMDLAVERGVNALECDVRMTKDGALVIMHDPTVDRTTDGHGSVRGLTLTEFRGLTTDHGYHPPTLEEVLAQYQDRELTLFLEIKDTRPAMLAPLAEMLSAHRGKYELIVFAIPPRFLADLKSRAPWIKVFLAPLEPFTAVATAQKYHLDGLLVADFFLSKGLVTSAHRRGLPVVASMTSKTREVRRAVALGVDGALVDDPAQGFAPLPPVR